MIEHEEELIEMVRQSLMRQDQARMNRWRAWSEVIERPITVERPVERVQPRFLDRETAVCSTLAPHPDHIEITFDHTEHWNDFNETNIDQAFRGFFQHQIPSADHLAGTWLALAQDTVISMEEDLNDFFVGTVCPILHHALECSRVLLKEATDNTHVHTLRFPDKCRPFAIRPFRCDEGGPKRVKFPNFPIYVPRRSLEQLKPNRDVVFVTGETAQMVTFHPACFSDKETFAAHGSTHLAKLAMYARKYTNTCLAFTCTCQSVTVFRFFIVACTGGGEELGVQHQTFAWRPALRGQMSAAKAIMALIVMGLNPKARRFHHRMDLGPLNLWSWR